MPSLIELLRVRGCCVVSGTDPGDEPSQALRTAACEAGPSPSSPDLLVNWILYPDPPAVGCEYPTCPGCLSAATKLSVCARGLSRQIAFHAIAFVSPLSPRGKPC